MTKIPCESYEHQLIDYADGELTDQQAAPLLNHLASCAKCRSLLHHLNRSMVASQTLWQQNLTCQGHYQTNGFKKRIIAIAGIAATLLIGTGIWLWNRPAKPAPLTMAQMEQTIEQSGQAARLLALADILARYQAQNDLAQQRYHYIVETFPQTPSALIAKTRLQ